MLQKYKTQIDSEKAQSNNESSLIENNTDKSYESTKMNTSQREIDKKHEMLQKALGLSG